jgi:hypothetical protein
MTLHCRLSAFSLHLRPRTFVWLVLGRKNGTMFADSAVMSIYMHKYQSALAKAA